MRDGHTRTGRVRGLLCTDAHEGRGVPFPPLDFPPAPSLGADLAGVVAFLHFAGLARLLIDLRVANDHVGWKKLLWPD